MARAIATLYERASGLVVFLLVFFLISGIALLILNLLLERYRYRLLRRLWENKQRERRLSFIQEFPISASDIVFLGDTHVADYRWEEGANQAILFNRSSPTTAIRNLGIADERISELQARLVDVIEAGPKQIVLHTGGSDVRMGVASATIISGIQKILHQLTLLPDTKVLLVGILPQSAKRAKTIRKINRQLAELATRLNIPYIDVYDELAADNGALGSTYTEDSYHLWAAGYAQLEAKILPHIN